MQWYFCMDVALFEVVVWGWWLWAWQWPVRRWSGWQKNDLSHDTCQQGSLWSFYLTAHWQTWFTNETIWTNYIDISVLLKQVNGRVTIFASQRLVPSVCFYLCRAKAAMQVKPYMKLMINHQCKIVQNNLILRHLCYNPKTAHLWFSRILELCNRIPM